LIRDESPTGFYQTLSREALKNPRRTVSDVLGTLQEQGLVQSVAKLRELLGAAEVE
jgi:hypothetical protein